MCGRLNVIDDPLTAFVSEELAIRFRAQTNRDLRPSEHVETVICDTDGTRQLGTVWGIQPSWAKRLIINAMAETVAEKRTFRSAFASRRCLVPCSGWYEWRDEGGPHKTRYLFSQAEGRRFYMAAIWFPGGQKWAPAGKDDTEARIVTLTTAANETYAAWHNRMPALIPSDAVNTWLTGGVEIVMALLTPAKNDIIRVMHAEVA